MLVAHVLPAEKEEHDLRGLSPLEIGNFYFLLAAVCHQTSPRGKPPLEGTVGGARRRGWDYLAAKFAESVRDDRSLLWPQRWVRMDEEEFATIFRDAEFGERLSDPARRAALVRDLGQVIQREGRKWIGELYEHCEGRIATGTPNLLSELRSFEAYGDPVKKKSMFFLTLMRNSGAWAYVDEDRLEAPVDYHEVRGHLRLGTVNVNDRELHEKLLTQLPVRPDEDVAIRGAVQGAIREITAAGRVASASLLHYLFWNIFRSCCTREAPHCEGCPPDCVLPLRYVPLAVSQGSRRCPFAAVCASAGAPTKYYEHVFETEYY